VYQSSVWTPLLQVNCHKDSQLFLCSLFAPVCVEQQSIFPCRSLCETVKKSCEGPMLSYNYPWPSMFNCSRFPEDNGLCIPPSDKMPLQNFHQDTSISELEPMTTTKLTTISTTKAITKVATRTQRPKTKNEKSSTSQNRLNQNPFLANTNACFSCDEDSLSMEQIVYGYCNSDIVLRGRVQSIKISKLDSKRPLNRFKSPSKNGKNANNFNTNKTRSLLLKIDRRDRRVLKGNRFLNPSILEIFLNENSRVFSNYPEEYEELDQTEQPNRELNIYLLSNLHLAEANLRSDIVLQKAYKSRDFNLMNKYNKTHNMRQRLAKAAHCTCEKIRKGPRGMNTKFLLMVNVLKSRNLYLNESPKYSLKKNRRDLSDSSIDHNATSTIKIIRSNGDEQVIVRQSGTGQTRNSHYSRRLLNKKYREASARSNNEIQLIYLTNFVQWHKARAFIDFLENDSINKQNMCKNIKRTVKRINRAFNSLI
jgi:hypothetical protein